MLLTILLVAAIALLCAVGGVFVLLVFKLQDEKEPIRDWFGPLEELSIRQEALETRWKRHLEELDDRVEAGNTAWRRIRSTEAARIRREERSEELEGEPVDDAQTLLELDAGGSDPRGLSYMPRPVGDSVEESWRTVAKQLAQQIAQGGGN
jgi:hypothetical protein